MSHNGKSSKNGKAETEIMFKLGKPIDWSKFVIEPPHLNVSKDNQSFKWTTSAVYYPGPNGERMTPYFQLEKQAVYGFMGQWPQTSELAIADRTKDNIIGFQVVYPLSSNDAKTDAKKAKREKETKAVFDGIRNLTKEHVRKYGGGEGPPNPNIPQAQADSCELRIPKGQIDTLVKQMYEFPKKFDERTKTVTKEIDTTKSQRTYLEVDSYYNKKNGKLRVNANVFDSTGEEIEDLREYMNFGEESHRGEISIALKWSHIYWGQHGKESSVVASAKIMIAEIIFKKLDTRRGPGQKLLTYESDSNSEDDNNHDDGDDDNDDGAGFDDPFQRPESVPLARKEKVEKQEKQEKKNTEYIRRNYI